MPASVIIFILFCLQVDSIRCSQFKLQRRWLRAIANEKNSFNHYLIFGLFVFGFAGCSTDYSSFLSSLIEVGFRPIALDVLVHSPERIELTIRVLEVPKYVEPAAGLHLPQFKLHSAVFHNQTLKLQELLAREPAVDANMADSHGNTPLHLACMLGRRTAVDVLLRYGALPSVPNKEGWHAIAEATSFGDRRILERVW